MPYVGTAQDTGDDLYTIASIIQGEAGQEGLNGMRAVASVIKNRADSNFSGYGLNPVSQATAHKQFQGQDTPSKAAFKTALDLLGGRIEDNTSGALYYANPSASTAKWATNLNEDNALKIGNHYFTDNTQGKPFQVADNSVGKQPSTYDNVRVNMAASLPSNQIAGIVDAYQKGIMQPEERTQFEDDVKSGRIMLPQGAKLDIAPKAIGSSAGVELPQSIIDAYNDAAKNPYNQGSMSVEERKQLDADLAGGRVKLPNGVTLNQTYPGIVANLKESVTGAQRQTPATQNLPEMMDSNAPGLFTGSNVSPEAKAAAATALLTATDPHEMAKILKATNPDIGIAEDEKGNLIAANNKTGAEVMLNKPGISKIDLLQTLGLGAAYLPTSAVTSLPRMAVAGAVTQGALEASHAAAGGTFDPKAIAESAIIPSAVIGAARVAAGPARALLGAIKGEAAPVADAGVQAATPQITPAARPLPGDAGYAAAKAPIAPVAAPTVADAAQATEQIAAAAAPSPRQQIVAARSAAVQASPEIKASTDALAAAKASHAQAEKEVEQATVNAKAAGLDHEIAPEVVQAQSVAEKAAEDLKAAQTAHKDLVNSVADKAGIIPSTNSVAPLAPTELAQVGKQAVGGYGAVDAQKVLAEQAMPNAKKVAAFEDLGIPKQPDLVSDNVSFRQLAQVFKSQSGSPAFAEQSKILENAATRADKAITDFGGTHDLAGLSNEVKANLTTFQKATDKKVDDLYGQLKAAIPAKAEAPADNVLSFINKRADELGGKNNLSSMEKQILGKLSPKQVAPELPAIPAGRNMSAAEYKAYEAAKAGTPVAKQPTYALLDDVRKDIGDGLKNSGPFKDANLGLKKKLYSLLSSDQEAVAKAHGADKLWEQAKAAVTLRKAAEDKLTVLFGKRLDGTIVNTLKNATEVLAKGDATKLVNMIKSIPDDMKQRVVSSALANAFEIGSRSGKMNFNGFARWYEGLLQNKPAYHALMTNLPPEARKTLSNLYRVADGISRSTKEFLGTGKLGVSTRKLEEAFNKPASLLENLYNIAHKAGKGIALEAATSAIGMHGAGITAGIVSALRGEKTAAIEQLEKLISSPEFQKSAEMIAKGQEKQAIPKLAYSRPFIQFARSVGKTTPITNKERWIAQALEVHQNSNDSGNK